MVSISRAALREAMAGSAGLINGPVPDLRTPKDHNEVGRTECLSEAILQCVVKKAINEKLGSVKFKAWLICQAMDVTSSPANMKQVKETMMSNQDFIATVTTIVKKITKMTVSVVWKNKAPRTKLVDGAHSTSVLSALSSEQPTINIPDDRTNKKVYLKISEEPISELPPWGKVMAGPLQSGYKPEPERELDEPSLNVAEPANDCFATTVNH